MLEPSMIEAKLVPVRHMLLPFQLAGAGCLLRSNSHELVEIIAEHTEQFTGETVCTLNVEVVSSDSSPVAPAHFRGMHHVVLASFGAANIFAFDLLRGTVTARVSGRVAANADFWRWTLLPIAAGVLGARIGVLPVHSACLARDGSAMLIAGESGAGKSTLALALAKRGFEYLSDDWTYCIKTDGALQAHGTGARIKLLPDAAGHFPLLKQFEAGESMNGERAFEVMPDEAFGIKMVKHATPTAFVFYRRIEHAAARATQLDGKAALRYLENSVERLPTQLPGTIAARRVLMNAIAELPCWRFECGGPPDAIAAEVEAFYEQRLRAGL